MMNPIKSRDEVELIINQALRDELDDIIVLDVEVGFTSEITQRIAGIKLRVDLYDDGSEADYYIKPAEYDTSAGFVVFS